MKDASDRTEATYHLQAGFQSPQGVKDASMNLEQNHQMKLVSIPARGERCIRCRRCNRRGNRVSIPARGERCIKKFKEAIPNYFVVSIPARGERCICISFTIFVNTTWFQSPQGVKDASYFLGLLPIHW